MNGLCICCGIARTRSEAGENTSRHARGRLRISRRASAVDESILLCVTKPHTKTLCDMCCDIEGTVVQQLVGDLNHASELVCRQGLLCKTHIGFLDGCTLLNPGCGTGIGRNRDRTSTGIGMDGLSQRTEDVILLQGLDKLSLKFIRHGVATVLADANGKRIPDFKGVIAAHHVPESIVVLSGCCRTDLTILLRTDLRVAMYRDRCRRRQLSVHLHLVF